MRDFLKQYQCSLTVVGPVFIGSGRELSKKEYMFLDNNSRIGVLDIGKMYALVGRKHLEKEFEQYMLGSNSLTLSRWLGMQHIRTSEVTPAFRYILDCGDTVMDRGLRTDIYEFVKDPMGQPYVPGTSIKGMLRTLLLTKELVDSSGKYQNAVGSLRYAVRNDESRNRTQYLKKNAAQLEETAFRTMARPETRPGDAVNDILSGLVISDSDPLTTQDLVMCQKCDLHTDNRYKKLNVIRECIRPGTVIHFTMSVDESVCGITPDEIRGAIEIFNNVYYDTFLHSFTAIGRRLNSVYLGGGCGFGTKTVLYPALGKDDGLDAAVEIFKRTLGYKIAEQHQHDRDRAYGVSPHVVKLTRYQGKLMMMGECRLEIR